MQIKCIAKLLLSIRGGPPIEGARALPTLTELRAEQKFRLKQLCQPVWSEQQVFVKEFSSAFFNGLPIIPTMRLTLVGQMSLANSRLRIGNKGARS